MSRSDIPDDSKVIRALREGDKDGAAHRILEDLQKIEHGPGTPQQKLAKEQAYLGQLQGDGERDRELQRLGFAGFEEVWTFDGKGHKFAPKLISDANHNDRPDSNELQVDLTNTVLGDHLTGKALKSRTAGAAPEAGKLQALTPKVDHSLDEKPPLQGRVADTGAMLQGKVDASGQADKPRVFKLGTEQFVKSDTIERLPDGRTIDWTKWHHDMVFAVKREFDQLLANSPELRTLPGTYGNTGSIKLQFDVKRDGSIEYRGCEGASFYGADPAARARFQEIARQALERTQYNPALRFPPGSQRSVNSTELEIGLNTGRSTQWQRNDRERLRR
ncbi:MAG TPA: hypothetical protein V6D08_00145 [Candidatus Obscuribacterales bacterium]